MVAPISFGLSASELIGLSRNMGLFTVAASPLGITILLAAGAYAVYEGYNNIDIPSTPDTVGVIDPGQGIWVKSSEPDPIPKPDPNPDDLGIPDQKKLSNYNNSMDYIASLDSSHPIIENLANDILDRLSNKMADELTLMGKNPDGNIPDLTSIPNLKQGIKDNLLKEAKNQASGGSAPAPKVAEKQKVELEKEKIDLEKKAQEDKKKSDEDTRKVTEDCNEALISVLDGIKDILESIADNLDLGTPDLPNSGDECKCITIEELHVLFSKHFSSKDDKSSMLEGQKNIAETTRDIVFKQFIEIPTEGEDV